LGWPDIGSHFGVFDQGYFPKATALYYAAWWTAQAPGAGLVTIFPHWTRPEASAGTPAPLFVYANAVSVQLFVNGVPAGAQPQPMAPFGMASFPDVLYAPGNVTAVAYDASGAVAGTAVVFTVGAPAALSLRVDDGSGGIAGDGADVAILSCAVVDATGMRSPVASNNVSISVSGGGAVYGVGNGDPASHDADKGVAWRPVFNGLLRILIVADPPTTVDATLTVTVSSPGLVPAQVQINVTAAPPPIV